MSNAEVPAPPDIIRAIGEMTDLCAKEGISKKQQNKDQNYKFRGIDDVRNFLAPLQAQVGLVIYPEIVERTATERTTKNGGFALHVVVRMNFHFVSRRDGSEIVVPMVNEAIDYSDKATNKAISQAYKTACINTFNIPTEGEEDTDEDKKKDLRGGKRMAHESREACDNFVKGYLEAVAAAQTRHTLRDLGTVHAMKMEAMKNSEDDHERMAATICRDKHKEALEEIVRKEAEAAKARPQTVSSAKAKGGEDGQ